jgi:hypothetical protein
MLLNASDHDVPLATVSALVKLADYGEFVDIFWMPLIQARS